MKAMTLTRQSAGELEPAEREIPVALPGEVVVRVRACGVCRTDLHIVAGELKPLRDTVIPGHQIVGRDVKTGERFGVSWLGGVDGSLGARDGLKGSVGPHPAEAE